MCPETPGNCRFDSQEAKKERYDQFNANQDSDDLYFHVSNGCGNACHAASARSEAVRPAKTVFVHACCRRAFRCSEEPRQSGEGQRNGGTSKISRRALRPQATR